MRSSATPLSVNPCSTLVLPTGLLTLMLLLMSGGVAVAVPVQWTVASGGNGHWYEYVGDPVPAPSDWTSQQANAVARGGYLVTITSEAENRFISTTLGVGALGGCTCVWLGASQNISSPTYSEPAGGWEWVTGEPMTYTNWASGEPSNTGGSEDFLTTWFSPDATNVTWNDHYATGSGRYIIEWNTDPADPATYPDEILADSPVAYWRMGEPSGPIVDEVSGRQGTLSGGNTTGVAGAIVGHPDTAIGSGGGGGTISVPYDVAMNSPVFSIELWAKFGSNCTDGRENGNHCEVAGTYSLNIGPVDTLPQMTHSFTIWHGVTSGNGQILGPTVEYDRWYHLVGSYDGSVQDFYVDGVLVGSNAIEFTFQNQDFRLFGGGNKAMENGTIDEVAYYDYALPADRVLAHYQVGSGIPTCPAPGSFTASTASLAASQDNYCEDWFGISQPGENLQDALLTWTDLTNANFAGSLLFNVDFTNALLTNASLFNARFEGAILNSANLAGADLSFATMTGAFYDESTVFPSGNTYETAQTGLDGDQRPWEAGMIPVPEPGFGITLIIACGLTALAVRRGE